MSSQSYDSFCMRWISSCIEMLSDPISGPKCIKKAINFQHFIIIRITALFTEFLQDSHYIYTCSLVSRLLKRAVQALSPLTRYTNTWDVNVVLAHLNKHEVNETMTLRQLTWCTDMLSALTSPSWSAAWPAKTKSDRTEEHSRRSSDLTCSSIKTIQSQ